MITGKNGYIAQNLNLRLSHAGHEASLKSVRETMPGMAGFDAVIHCAGIAHRKAGEDICRRVNADLTRELALKAKNEGVKIFIYFSTMAVYGVEGSMGKPAAIGAETPLRPRTPYAKSKLEAEGALKELAGGGFYVFIIRPPMVYGRGCPGNFGKLVELVKRIPVFPKTDNARALIHIDNLCEFVKMLLDQKYAAFGDMKVFCPQNIELADTSRLVSLIGLCLLKKVRLSALMGKAVRLFHFGPIPKVFGSLYYDPAVAGSFGNAYNIRGFEESVRMSVDAPPRGQKA
jgi:UDP-glucose 4-epimerase